MFRLSFQATKKASLSERLYPDFRPYCLFQQYFHIRYINAGKRTNNIVHQSVGWTASYKDSASEFLWPPYITVLYFSIFLSKFLLKIL